MSFAVFQHFKKLYIRHMSLFVFLFFNTSKCVNKLNTIQTELDNVKWYVDFGERLADLSIVLLDHNPFRSKLKLLQGIWEHS